MDANEKLLTVSLQGVVPIWIMNLRTLTEDDRIKMAGEAAQIIAEKGDLIMFKSKKPGESAKAFNALAKAIAILSFSPGGVNFMGLHFETKEGGSNAG